MKKIFYTLVAVLTAVFYAAGQAPQAINYQAVARDSAGAILTNRNISVRITILRNSITGTEVYKEVHNTQVNPFGLINLAIGAGTVVSGDFSLIPWDSYKHFLKVEIDPDNGNNYFDFGTTQLLSVPYAIYSATTGDTSTWRKGDSLIYYDCGRVGIGTTNPDSSAALDLSSTTSGLLPPRLTWNQMLDIPNPATGLVVYNLTDNKLMYYDGTNWYDSDGTCRPLPTVADAGPDQFLANTNTTTLEANTPTSGAGVWSIISGEGGVITDTTDPAGTFTGTSGDSYTLRWTISTTCTSSYDDVIINFCGGTFIDIRDGQSYAAVKIGTQCWMAQNLNIGTRINGNVNMQYNGVIEKYCYNDDTANCSIYGGLYQWNEAMNYSQTPGAQGICPDGWHIPTDEEWCTLTTYLDATVNCAASGLSGTDAGGKMKEMGFIHWNPPNTGATNSSGFTGLPGGGVWGPFYVNYWHDKKNVGYIWSSTQSTGSDIWINVLCYNDAHVERNHYNWSDGLSIRCLKNP